ncbi:NUDIX domain-containing protein [Nakamurella deserti]|uniref:NUDIX domain-containing protein n=1 Tax=Nakamurella deserti TaxID=2164074 RepID=UPI001300B3E7|nr:NUDIX domain-containing protein [Nakamurella deserti]
MTARHRMPTQLTAVVVRNGKVLLARRVHDQQWELPGGTADLDATDGAVELSRLVRASTGQAVVVGPEVYDTQVTTDDGPVQLIAFGCHLEGRLPLQISERYRQVAWLPVDELPLPNLAAGSEDALRAWLAHRESGGAAPS